MKYKHCEAADKYARDVIAGRVDACKWIKLACKRHLDDLKAHKKFYFDSEAGEKACEFVEKMPHTKGKWAREGKLLTLEPWQSFFVANIFGWKQRKNGLRRYRRAELWVPRKNGKSALAAAIGLYMLVVDGEYGAEVYSGATTQAQAWEVFKPAKMMAEKSPDFREYYDLNVNASNMSVDSDGSKFEPVIGKPRDGASPHCAIVDEYHEHDDDSQVETMETGMGAREQPLLLMITTAGDNIAGPCYMMQLDAQKMLEGTLKDDSTFAMMYGADDKDEWDKLATLKKANPNYGVSVYADYLKNQLHDARTKARKQASFKTKHLNIWVGSRDAYFNLGFHNRNADSSIKLEDYHGQRAYIGLDLSSKVDIAALEILICLDDETFVTFGKHYLPESRLDVDHYNTWMTEGKLNITGGEIIDYNEIKEDILELCGQFQIEELAYDPFQATKLVTELMDEGVPVVEMRPTVLNFSEPMKELDALIRDGRLKHDGDPVFSWMLSNVTGKMDKKDNVYPNKERDENKIDGPVALMMALGRAMQDDSNGLMSAINNPLRTGA